MNRTIAPKLSLFLSIFIALFSINGIGQNKPDDIVKSGKTIIKKDFQPKKTDEAHLHSLSIKKGQTLSVKLSSKSVMLTAENECNVVFMIYDSKGKVVTKGDFPEGGTKSWKGKIEKAGVYQIEIFMGCVEAQSLADLQKKKPKFRYSLEILLK
jgi:hypothetical protein